MQLLLATLVSIVGAGFTLAYITKRLADVLQPASSRNTWSNAWLTVAAMALVTVALLASQFLSVVRQLPVEVQAVGAAMAVFGVLALIVTKLFDMETEEVVAAAPVIGTTTAVVGGVLFFAIGTLSGTA